MREEENGGKSVTERNVRVRGVLGPPRPPFFCGMPDSYRKGGEVTEGKPVGNYA